MLNTIPSANILIDAFWTLDPADVSAGVEWYATAHSIAESMAICYGVTVDQAAGVIAALSPQQGWAHNVKSAERFLADNTVSVHTKANMVKCQRIVKAASRDEILAILHADKTSNFFLSIATCGEFGVTIDRHAIDIALGVRHTEASRPNIGKRLYRDAADAYVRAADALGAAGVHISPAELQSVLWDVHTKRHGGTRAGEPFALTW